jgi:hypothetical protein
MSTDTSQPPRQPPRKRKRVFAWVFLAIQVIFLGWVIYAGVSAPQKGLGIQMGLWALTDILLGAIYMIRQLPRTPRLPSPP